MATGIWLFTAVIISGSLPKTMADPIKTVGGTGEI